MTAASSATIASKKFKLWFSGWTVVMGTITGNAVYPALGYNFRAADLGLASLNYVVPGSGGAAVTYTGKWLDNRMQFRRDGGEAGDNEAAVDATIIPFIAIGY